MDNQNTEPATEPVAGLSPLTPVRFDRLTLITIGTFLLTTAFMAYRSSKLQSVPDEFFVKKLFKPPIYDIVIVGDSKVYRGIAPEEIKRATGLSAFDFSFNAMQVNRQSLDYAEKLLKPNGARIMIINADHGGLADSGSDMFRSLLALKQIELLNIFTLGNGQRYIQTKNSHTKTREYDDGFVWTATTNGKAYQHGAIERFGYYDKPSVRDRIFQWVNEAKGRGIRFFALCVPASPELAKWELTKGYDPAEEKRAFEAAGIEWIDVPGTFQTWDGTHLLGDEAVRYSRQLGAALAKKLGAKPTEGQSDKQ